MTVYVGTGLADKPRVQHLASPIPGSDEGWPYERLSLCRFCIIPAEEHDRRRRQFGFGKKSLTHIAYDGLPMCKRCTKIHEKAVP